MNRSLKRCAWLAVACIFLFLGPPACQSVTTFLSSTQYSQNAYDADKSIKEKSLELVDRAKKDADYTAAAADVNQLLQQIDNAMSSEQSRVKNRPTVEEWKRVKTELSHFFDLWKTKGKLSPAFVDEAKQQIGALFDTLIRTEDEKRSRA